MDFIEKGKEIRNLAKQIVLKYMVDIPYTFGLEQAEIFNNLEFGWGNQKSATSTNQQYWIVALLRQLEGEGFIRQDELTLYWTITEKAKQFNNDQNYKNETVETLKEQVALLKKESIRLVLTYMEKCKNERKNVGGFQQAYIFRQCGFDFGNYDKAESTRQQFWLIGLLRHLENEHKIYRDERKKWKFFNESDKQANEIREILKTKEVRMAFNNILNGLSLTKNNEARFLLGIQQLFKLYSFKTNFAFKTREVLTHFLLIDDKEHGYSLDKAFENIENILNNIVCQLCFPSTFNLNMFDYKKAKLTLDEFDNISKILVYGYYYPFTLNQAILYLMEAFIKTEFYLNDDRLSEKIKEDIFTFRNDLHIILSKYLRAGIGTPGKKNLDENEFDEYEDDDEEK